MADKRRSTGVNANANDDLNVGRDIVGRDEINTVTTTNIEGGPVARYAILGIVLVALVAIVALVLVLVMQPRTANPPSGVSDIVLTSTAVARATSSALVAGPTAPSTSGTVATPVPAITLLADAGLPPTYTPVVTQPPPPAVNITNNEGQSTQPRLAFDGQGILHVVWSDNSLRREGDLFHRQLTPQGQWSSTESLTSEQAGFYDTGMQLLNNPAGQVCAIWRLVSGGAEIVMRCRQNEIWRPRSTVGKGGPYSFAFSSDGQLRAIFNSRGQVDVFFEGHILSAGPNYNLNPNLVIDAHGGYHVVWVSTGNGNPYRLEYRYSGDSGHTWRDITHLSTDDNSPDLDFDLLADSIGNVHLVWHGFHGGLFYRRWSSTGDWSEAVTLSAPGTGLGQDPRLAVSTQGVVHAAFGTRIEGVYYMKQASDGTWSAPREISGTGNSPRIALDTEGTAHIVWVQKGDLYYAVAK